MNNEKIMNNQLNLYDQFIYGKLTKHSDYEVVACSANIKNKLQNLTEIANTYKIGNTNSPKGDNAYTSAVGIFNFMLSEQSYLVVVQEIIPSSNLFRDTFPSYRYVFFPQGQLSLLKYRTFNLILEFFTSDVTQIKSLREKDYDYQQFSISLTQLSIPQIEEPKLEENKLLSQLIKECCQEDSKFLFLALTELINGQRILMKQEEGKLDLEYHYLVSILSLLPAICRQEVQIAVGNFNEQDCNWANLLLKFSDSNSNSLPSECIFLDRQRANNLGFDNQNNNQLEYIRIISDIITEKEAKIFTLIKDLDSINYTSIKLSDLREPDIREKLKSEQKLEKSNRITVYGTSGSGKSTFLVRLHDAIQKGKSEFDLIAIDEKTNTFIRNLETKLYNNEPIPRTSTSDTELELFTITLAESYRLLNSKIEFSFIDPAGEFFEEINISSQDHITIVEDSVLDAQNITKETNEIESETQKVTETDQQTNQQNKGLKFIEYLSSCKGIIFLIDPERKKGNVEAQNVKPSSLSPYQIILRNLFNALKVQAGNNSERIRDGKLTQYMAFCLTKMDEDELWERREDNTKDLVKEFLGSAFDILPTYCFFNENDLENSSLNHCAFFAISSIGRYKDENGDYKKAIERQSANSTYNNYQLFSKEDESTVSSPISAENSKTVLQSPIRQPHGKQSPIKGTTPSNSNPEKILMDKNPEPLNIAKPLEWLISRIVG